MGIKKAAPLLLLSCLLPAATGMAAEIHGRSSTQFQSFTNQVLNDQRQLELAEYLHFSASQLDKSGKLSIQGYGRGSQDFTNGEGLNGRLYYLYADYRDLFDKVDLKAGRQFVNQAAGTALMDGLQLDLKNVGPVAFGMLAGRDVVFGINGEDGHARGTVVGVNAYLQGVASSDAEVAWFRKYDGSSITRDFLGASFKQYLANSVKVYGNAKYDTTAEAFNELLGGAKYYPSSNLVLTGEYYKSYATFDTNSIYSVFAVNNYQEALFRADYTINDKVALNAGYNRQFYGDDGHANVYHLGGTLTPIESLRINAELDNRNGYYGNTNGVIVDASYDIGKASQVAGGVAYDVYQRDALTGEETARRYWLGGKYKLAGNMAVSARLQDEVNERYKNNVSWRAGFDYDF